MTKAAISPKAPPQDPSELLAFVEDLKRRWVETVDAIQDVLVNVDGAFNITKANKAAAKLALKPAVRDLIGTKCYQSLFKRDSPCEACPLASAQGWKNQQLFQFSLGQDFEQRFYEVTSQVVLDNKNEVEERLQIYRDRTTQKQLEAQLAHSDKLASLGLLAGGVAHELNNPLGGILIFSQVLLKDLPESAPIRADIAEIEKAAQRAKSIVENLLSFARHKPKHKEPSWVNLVKVIRNAKTLGLMGKSHGIEVIEDYSDEELSVYVEEQVLHQLLLNLIQNAVHAMPQGGKLRFHLTTDKKAEHIWLDIEDSGMGMEPEVLKRIFDPFFTTKAEGEGTGLGLSICYGLAKEMGSTIKVWSKPKKGSTFRIIFPILKP